VAVRIGEWPATDDIKNKINDFPAKR